MAEVTVYNRVIDHGRRRCAKATKEYDQDNFFLRYRHNGRQAQLLRVENLPESRAKERRLTEFLADSRHVYQADIDGGSFLFDVLGEVIQDRKVIGGNFKLKAAQLQLDVLGAGKLAQKRNCNVEIDVLMQIVRVHHLTVPTAFA